MRAPPGRSMRAEVEVDGLEVCLLHQDMVVVVVVEVGEMVMEDQELLKDTEMITEMIIGEEEVVGIEEVLHLPDVEVEMMDSEEVIEEVA